MKKIIIVMLALIASTSDVFGAPERTGKIDLGFNVGGIWPDDDDFSSAGYVGGSVAYGVNSWFAIGFSSGFTNDSGLEVSPGPGLPDASGGDVSAVPIFADLILRWPNRSQFVPYAVLGLGALIPWAESDQLLNQNLKASKETDFAAKLGAGVDWFANKNWIVNLETHYVWTDAGFDIRDRNTSRVIESKSLDYWYFGGGVKYLYD